MSQTPTVTVRPDADLLQRYDRPGPRYTSYPTAVQFHEGFDADAYRSALDACGPGPLSIYVHLPFCEARCLYCACNVVITRKRSVADPYLHRVKREMDLVAERLSERRSVGQFHFGGGTPTYYRPEQLTAFMDHVRARFELLPNAELAVEVDPRVTTFEHLAALAEHGFRRMSLGVQDFDPVVQEAVHRVQSVEQTRSLMEHARELGFTSINLDLIYGLPHQTPTSFARTMDGVVELKPDRLAVYSFALVPWLKHHQKLLPQDALPTGTEKLELQMVARERLLGAGYRDIGMDHFALPGDELSLAQDRGTLWRNFMGYTATRLPETIGFGASAIGSVGGAYVQNEKKLNRYQRAVDAGEMPVERGYALDADDRIRRDVIQAWMCQFRVDKAEVERTHGIDFDAYFARELGELRALELEGLVHVAGDAISGGEFGKAFPRNVAMVFDRYLPQGDATAPRFSRTV